MWLFESKKVRSGWGTCSTHRHSACSEIYALTQRIWKGILKEHTVFVFFVISFVFFFFFFQCVLNHCFGQRYREFNMNMSLFIWFKHKRDSISLPDQSYIYHFGDMVKIMSRWRFVWRILMWCRQAVHQNCSIWRSLVTLKWDEGRVSFMIFQFIF